MARLLGAARNPFDAYRFEIGKTPFHKADQGRELAYRVSDETEALRTLRERVVPV